MSKITKAIAALGVVAGLGVAALPLSSYAAQTTVPVKATIDASLSISTSAEEVSVENVIAGGEIEYSDLTVTVATNVGGTADDYDLTIKDSDSITALVNGANSIPGVAPTKGSSGWGYAVADPIQGTTVGAYTAVTLTDTSIADAAELTGGSAATVLRFGVSAEQNQAAGTYVGGVILTATAK